jgi:hypothetical protein
MTVANEVRIFAIFYVPESAAQFKPLIMISCQVFTTLLLLMTVAKEVRIFAIFYLTMLVVGFKPLIMIVRQVFYHCATTDSCVIS